MMTETLANIHVNRQQRKMDHQNNREKTPPSSPTKSNSALALFHMKQEKVQRAGSFVVGQKLRESKWFSQEEIGIFCAVVESGFIIEQKSGPEEITKYGVAMWAPGFEKSKNPEYLTIFTLSEPKGKSKICGCTLGEFWPESTVIRLNNKSDRTETPLDENIIRNQISAAQNSKKNWHNSEHFAYFCRYGPVEANNVRMRKITDQLRWNTGSFFLKIRSLTSK